MKYLYNGKETGNKNGVRKWFPNKSLPATITAEVLSSLGVEVEEMAEPVPTFEEMKEAKKAEIAQAHKEYITGSINTSLGYPMQFNMSDSLMVGGAIELAQANGATTIYLTDAEDRTHYDVPLADAQAIFLEMATAFAEAHAKKQLLRQQIESATTQAELDAIEW